MLKTEIINKEFKKNPFILKIIKKFNLDELNNKEFHHFIELLKKYINNKPVVLDLHACSDMNSLYESLLFIFKEKRKSYTFNDLNIDEKCTILKDNNIEHILTKQKNLLIYPKNFEETKLISPSEWCISRNSKTWHSYNKEGFLIFCSDNLFLGFSKINKFYICFDHKNNRVYNEQYKNIDNYLSDINLLNTESTNYNYLNHLKTLLCYILCYEFLFIFTFIGNENYLEIFSNQVFVEIQDFLIGFMILYSWLIAIYKIYTKFIYYQNFNFLNGHLMFGFLSAPLILMDTEYKPFLNMINIIFNTFS